jgi:hypothetical protein
VGGLHVIFGIREIIAKRHENAAISERLNCERCHGTGLVTLSYGGDGYGDRCSAMADADDQPCPDCTEEAS